MAHDDVALPVASSASRRVLVPRTPVPSRAANVLMWVGLLWAVAFTLVADTVLTGVGLPRTPRPLAVTALILVVGWTPLVVGVFAGWLGRIPGLTWLLSRSQPRLELDEEGMTVDDGRGRTVRAPWREVAEIRIVLPVRRATVIGTDGAVLARIPGVLTTPRVADGGETRLADEIARFRPDLMRTHVEQQRVVLLIAMLVLAGLAAVGVVAFVSR